MRGWLRTPVAMSRLTLLAITFFLGVIGAGGFIAGAAALRHAAAERDRAIAAERLTAGDVATIAERVFAIESPTRAELLARIQLALRACARDPRCRRSFQDTIRRASIDSAGATRPLERSATGRGTPARRDASSLPGRRRRGRPPATRRRDRRDASPPPGREPSPDPSPGPSRPNVLLPVPVSLCTPLASVNC